jgi:hypothetical protein
MPDDDDPNHRAGRADGPRAGPRRDRPLVQRAIVSDALMDPEERERIGFDPSPDAPIPVVVELNLRHRDGLAGAGRAVPRPLPGHPARRPRPRPGGRHLLPLRAHPGRHPAPWSRPTRRQEDAVAAGHLPGLARLPGHAADRRLPAPPSRRTRPALLRRHRPRHHLGRPGLRHRRRPPPLPPLPDPQGRRGRPAPRLHQAGRPRSWAAPWSTASATAPMWPASSPAACPPGCRGAPTSGWSSGSSTRPRPDVPAGPGAPGQPARDAGRDGPGDQAGQPQGASTTRATASP